MLGVPSEGRIRYEDFLRVIEGEGATGAHAEARDSSPARAAEAQRARLSETLHRAIARGVDYRREIELQGATSGANGIISCERYGAVAQENDCTMKDDRAQLSPASRN